MVHVPIVLDETFRMEQSVSSRIILDCGVLESYSKMRASGSQYNVSRSTTERSLYRSWQLVTGFFISLLEDGDCAKIRYGSTSLQQKCREFCKAH